MIADRILLMGRLGAAFGIKGYLKVQSFTAEADALFSYAPWLLDIPGVGWRETQVAGWQRHGSGHIVRLAKITTREQAAELAGLKIGICRSCLPPPEEGEFYLCDLEGCRVIGNNGCELGVVQDIVDQGASPLMVVTRKGDIAQRSVLIPFVSGPIVQRLDLRERVVEVAWDEDY